MGLQGDEIADEERIRVAHLAGKRLDQPIVGVQAAGENDRQEVHTSLATVKARTGTGPK